MFNSVNAISHVATIFSSSHRAEWSVRSVWGHFTACISFMIRNLAVLTDSLHMQHLYGSFCGEKKTHTHTNQGCCVVCCWPEALFSYLRIKPRDLSDVPMCCFHKLPAQPPEDSPLAPQPPAVDQTHRTSAHRDQWLQIRRARFTVWSSFKTLQTFLTHCWCFKTSFESWLSYMVQISLKKKNQKKKSWFRFRSILNALFLDGNNFLC